MSERTDYQKMQTDKETITRAEYHQLLGLMLLAKRHTRSLDEIVLAAKELLGEVKEHSGSHCDDEVFGRDQDADALLNRLGITVES